jgi:hypothetical protein
VYLQTPEKPKYDGGSWHIEGMQNESIVASGIYYYDEEYRISTPLSSRTSTQLAFCARNITESWLGFRMAVNGPSYLDPDDEIGTRVTYGLDR